MTAHWYRCFIVFISNRPITSFLLLLGLLFVLIVAGNVLRKPAPEQLSQPIPKAVRVYHIGEAPKMSVSAKVEKSGLVKIVALAPGVVKNISVAQGSVVGRGANLVSLAGNYQGDSAASTQRQIAQVQYNNAKDSYDLQKQAIDQQREVAGKTLENVEALRTITRQSLEATHGLIVANQGVLQTIDQHIAALTASNVNGANDGLIESARQMRIQFLSGLTQLQTAQKTAKYQANGNNPPGVLANLQREITQKQLDIQEKALNMGLEMGRLQVQLAQVQEAAMFPVAPFGGVVERIYVQKGQSVNPGTPLVLLHGNQDAKVVVNVSATIASQVSKTEPAIIHIGSQTVMLQPDYISTEATDNGLYAIIFTLPSKEQNNVPNASFLPVELSIGYPQTTKTIPFVPLDAIYQTQDKAYIYIVENGKAASREVELGEVSGNYVEITKGLTGVESIITSRNVVAGDPIQSV